MLNIEKMMGQLVTVGDGKSVRPYIKICEDCGMKFATHEEKDEIKKCLRCVVVEEMKLPPDTIVNQNILLLWKAGRYDKRKGLDPIIMGVSEGVILLDEKIPSRNHLSGFKIKSANKGNTEIEKYIKHLVYRSKGNYDAIVILRFSSKDSFSVYSVRFSAKLFARLATKSRQFKKRVCLSIVARTILKKEKFK